ncbi:MAG TPA: mandelate racemase/muconate lactonizing enzyme family protein [Fimbriimonas sp.]|nr:mandelate racemase/muconate lactonizing enzyme family protein [Fimbriimonas sp.]
MPQVLDVGDGSQDALLVRVRAGRYEGWGECEASPLTTMASFVAPMSHSACKPVGELVIGERLDSAEDIPRIHHKVRTGSFDLLQSYHTLSGIDIALWDLIGKRFQSPAYQLLGFEVSYAKTPYASVLFGDTPSETEARARLVAQQRFAGIKLGWGAFGKGSLKEDEEHLEAARAGLGWERALMVDAGTVWEELEAARERLPALEGAKVTWLEEPFPGSELGLYHDLGGRVPLAGGEGCNSAAQARQMIDYARLAFVQIDAGRVGGITDAHRVAMYADTRNVKFVNHTFTSNLALAASIHPYAGLKEHEWCEYPVEPKPLAKEITVESVEPVSGRIHLPEKPGLGVTVDVGAIEKYLVETEFKLDGKLVFQSSADLLKS